MFEKYLRPIFQSYFVDPLAKWLMQRHRVLPSHLTIVGCFIGILSAVAIGFEWIWCGLSLLMLSGILDTLDGTLARFKNMPSPFGSALDIVCDRIVEFAVIIGLYTVHADADPLYSLFMLGSILICVTSFLVVGIFLQNTGNKSFYYSPGLVERGEAFLFFALMIYFPSMFSLLASLFSALVFLTAAIRIFQFHRKQLA